ncbi:hypothetical protein [Oryza sativa Japonica Group]|uniref:Uncharacterized protein n=1 Tax=Oryza sativa subsp. japonica TaxID=39947 RepID=Q5N7Z6_ORYSJ|nr:hypothetical protein [Oryza sativa Japonica Group]
METSINPPLKTSSIDPWDVGAEGSSDRQHRLEGRLEVEDEVFRDLGWLRRATHELNLPILAQHTPSNEARRTPQTNRSSRPTRLLPQLATANSPPPLSKSPRT